MTPPCARLAAGLLGCALLAGAGVARAATFTVDSTADTSDNPTCAAAMDCTLRDAINAANLAAGADVIDFSIADDSTITLMSSLPNITGQVSIEGGTSNVTVQGPGMARVVSVETSAVEVVIMDVTVAGGGIPVGSGAKLVFDQTDRSGTYAQVISGAGSLEKTGPETLTLGGANTYTGGTTVTAGILEGNSTSLQGSPATTVITVSTPALDDADMLVVDEGLVFNQTANGSYNGTLTGTGNVFKRGAGQLTLGGDNSGMEGYFVFEKGTLFVTTSSAPPVIVNQGNVQTDAVVLSQSSNGTFTGRISGDTDGLVSAGSVAKTGNGNVSLEGTILAEVFTVQGGPFTLTDLGTLDGEFRLGSGGTLQGDSIADQITGSALLEGTVSPGGAGSIGAIRTLWGQGAAMDEPGTDFRSSSVLHIDIAEPGEADLFQASKIVVEEGARLELAVNVDLGFAGDLLVVQADPGQLSCPVGNQFCFEFDQDLFFFDITRDLTDPTTELRLIVESSDTSFGDVAQTQNEIAVAEVLDTARMDGELGDFFNSISGMEKSQGTALLNAMSGEIATGFATPRLAAKQILDRSLELQVRGFASRAPGFVPGASEKSGAGGPGVSLFGVGSAAGPGVRAAFQPDPGESGFGAWIDGYGVFGTAEGSGGAGDLDYGVYGTTLGLDARISEHFLVGVAAGYAHLEPELRSASGSGDLGQGALFASAVWDRVHVAGWGRYAYGGYETRRPIRFGADVTAKGSFDGWDYSGHGEVGVRVLDLSGFELRPLASIDYAHLEQDGYTEKGAVVGDSDLNLQIPGQSWNSLVSGLGARLHRVWELQEGTFFVPEIHARWLHEFEDTDRRVVPTLTGVGMAYLPFIQGAELERDGMVAGLGWTMSSAEGLHVYGDYEVNWNPKLLQQSIKAGFRFLF